MSWCRHYRSMGDFTHCKIGIEMQSLRDTSVVPHAFPCFTVGAEHLCAKYEGYTAEEIAEEKRQIGEIFLKMNAVMSRESEDCPHCGRLIQSMDQVGRCVYARPCGCRQYQGRVSKAWGGISDE